MPRLAALDPATATGDAKALLDGVQKKLGATPNLMRTMAQSPAVLKAFLSFGEALSGTRHFDAKGREAIALAVAGVTRCDYCASAHSAISRALKVDAEEITLRLEGRSADAKLQTALVFARKVVDTEGNVTDDDIADVRAAGYDDGAMAEIVAIVALNLFTNYLYHVADTEIDFPKVILTKVA